MRISVCKVPRRHSRRVQYLLVISRSYVVIGGALAGATWYLHRLATRPDGESLHIRSIESHWTVLLMVMLTGRLQSSGPARTRSRGRRLDRMRTPNSWLAHTSLTRGELVPSVRMMGETRPVRMRGVTLRLEPGQRACGSPQVASCRLYAY